MNWLGLDPRDLEPALWTIAVGIVANVSCALVGCYLVLRRMSLLGDAISHAVLPGIALAFLLSGQVSGLPIVLGAMAMGLLTTFLTQSIHWFGKVPEDASMGVVFTSLFALGVLLIHNVAQHVDLDPGCVLYGLIEFAPYREVLVLGFRVPRDLVTLGPTLLLCLVFVLALWKELKIVSFDPALATAMGINATLVHYLLMMMVAGVTVASFEAVGSILVVAMLIVPGACAHLLTDRLGWMMVWSAVVATLSAVFGYVLGSEWVLNTHVAGTMAVAAGLQFLVVVFLAPRHGILSKVIRNARLTLRIASEDVIGHLYRAEEAFGRGERTGAAIPFQAARRAARGMVSWFALLSLWMRGQIRFGPGWHVRLTDEGRERGQSILRAHRLWEAYLEEDFVLPLDHLHEPAERMEHYLSPALQRELASKLRQPAVDPHGREIPPLREQETAREKAGS